MERRVLFAAGGKDASVWPEFIDDLEAHNGHRHSLLQLSQDMSPAYLKGIREHCRNPTGSSPGTEVPSCTQVSAVDVPQESGELE